MSLTEMPATPGVIAGIDGSKDARHALAWATTDARARGCPLTLFHAADVSLRHAPVPSHIRDRRVMEAERILRDAREQVFESEFPHAQTHLVLQEGRSTDLLITASDRAVEIVLGRSGRRVFDSLLIGSTSRTVAGHAKAPVIVVPLEAPTEPAQNTVVVGVDGGPDSQEPIAFAVDLAARHGAAVEVVCVWGTSTDPYGETHAAAFDNLRGGAEVAVAEAVAGWQEKYPDVAISTVAPHGHPAKVLVSRSESARILVVGGRPRQVAGFLLGSVADAAVRYARCPVAVVRSADRATT